ncbi:MAG: TlpA disulfide reductase family protein [Methyloprofundus sp.]|nr:TlpA disulfide reductase family protein [Methyloprofundus sp.]MDT8426416.1 TlpA disulfide reductase family protein [Methyloprofundus sp.]
MPKPLFIFIFGFLILISTFFARYQSQKEQQALILTPLINFSLTDLRGEITPIAKWRGKILIINFWATWCPPCLKEIPDFIALQNEYADKNVQFIGIAIDTPELVADYLAFIDINYPILMAEVEGQALAKQLGNVVNAVPFTLIVNANNDIIFRHPGELSKTKIRQLIDPLVQQ